MQKPSSSAEVFGLELSQPERSPTENAKGRPPPDGIVEVPSGRFPWHSEESLCHWPVSASPFVRHTPESRAYFFLAGGAAFEFSGAGPFGLEGSGFKV